MNFIKLKIILCLSFIVSSLALDLNSPIVIIGGGISGVAAANQLATLGFKNVTILEAANRLGGRIHTIPYNGNYIEMGAQWIHGVNGNPVYKLMDSINEIDSSAVFYDPNGFYYYSSQDGKPIDQSFTDYVQSSVEDFFDTIYDQIWSINPNSQASIGSYLTSLYQNFLATLSTKYSNYNRFLVDAIYRSTVQDQKSNYACNSFNDITAAGVNEYKDFGGNPDVNLKTGYFKLIDLLRSKISTSSIKLNNLVNTIDYSNTNGQVVVNARNTATNVNQQYKADLVLVTVSLGVLKQNYKQMFVPSISATAKANAIEKLEIGTMNKIFVVYDRPYFTTQKGLNLYWREDLDSSLPNSDKKWNLYNNRFYKSFSSFHIPYKFKNILYADIVGSDSIWAESLPDEAFVDVIYEMLLKFYPYLNLPRPVQVIRSKWSSNPFVRGSYSFIKVGSYPSDVKALASPIQNKIFFSGEATDVRYMGTVHGGLITGIAQANKMRSLF